MLNNNHKHNYQLFKTIYEDYNYITRYINTNYNELIQFKYQREFDELEEKGLHSTEDLKAYEVIKEKVKDAEEGMKNLGVDEVKGLNQVEFSKLEEIYEQSKGTEKNFIFTTDKDNDSIYTYEWLRGDNPINLALRYITDSCSKLGDFAEDIMIQSMINENIANLVIKDEDNNIIAKATAYINEDYILFNSAESKKNKPVLYVQIEDAIKRASLDQVNALREKGIIINDVRIGLDTNIVYHEGDIKFVEHDLLENYNFKNTVGDASGKQGIIYSRYLENKNEERTL